MACLAGAKENVIRCGGEAVIVEDEWGTRLIR